MSTPTSILETITRLEDFPIVTVFTKNDCPICDQTKGFLTRKQIPFETINVNEDTAPRVEYGGRTPLDFVKETYGPQMPRIVLRENQDARPGDELSADSWSGKGALELTTLARAHRKLSEGA